MSSISCVFGQNLGFTSVFSMLKREKLYKDRQIYTEYIFGEMYRWIYGWN